MSEHECVSCGSLDGSDLSEDQAASICGTCGDVLALMLGGSQ